MISSNVEKGGCLPVILNIIELPFLPCSFTYSNFLNITKAIFPRCLLLPQAFLSLSCKSCKINSPLLLIFSSDISRQAFQSLDMTDRFCRSDPKYNILEYLWVII